MISGAFLTSDVLMVSFVPEVEKTSDMLYEFVFIIDRSGKNRRYKQQIAKLHKFFFSEMYKEQ